MFKQFLHASWEYRVILLISRFTCGIIYVYIIVLFELHTTMIESYIKF